MLRRFLAHPEFRAVDGEPSDDATLTAVYEVNDDGSEGRRVEFDGSGATPYG